MRASRLLALLLHLQVRGHSTARELAQRFEVSERTIQRDVEALAAQGVPVRSVRGPAGGYLLAGGYRTRLTGLAADEAESLTFLGLAGPAAQLGLSGVLDTARTKVWAALTGEARDRAEHTAQRFHLDPVRFYGTTEPTPQLLCLAEAVRQDRRVLVDYNRSGQIVRRRLDPLGLVLAAGDWYLVANRDGASGDGASGDGGGGDGVRRTYRVARFVAVRQLDEVVRRPPGFRLAEAWATSRREMETRHTLVDVTVRIEPAELPRLRRVVAVSGQDRVDVTLTGAPVELTVPFEGERWAAMALLGMGGAVEVLGPPSLRAYMAAQARAMLSRYEPADGAGPGGGAGA
ncbi:MAG TPA: WYL domain-containing protein [Micromonosporaceae bacterium]|nr:WYL domain-containing protein [Micromonosporaceae bacterium]